MERQDIVVIGASAGGIPALTTLLGGLPADLPAAIFVVVHIPPYAVSRLPEILGRAGPLPAAAAVHGEAIAPGRVYVAPPNQHLLVRPGRVEVTGGPRENHVRPAVDPLFRSAARAYGPRVAGVVLSGALHDGSAGLLAVKSRGGVAIVQDPADAAVESMPRRALELVTADYTVPVEAIAPILVELTTHRSTATGGKPAMVDEEERLELVIREVFQTQANDQRAADTTVYTCPDCGGVLWQDASGARLHFRCHVGHAYAPEVLLDLKSDELEAALWSSVRLLKEKATLTRQLAAKSRDGGNDRLANRGDEHAALTERQANAIRELVETMPINAAADPDEPVAIHSYRPGQR